MWEIVNLTADAHPIHLHLVQFQLINRQNFNTSKYTTAYDAPSRAAAGPDDGRCLSAGVFMPGFGPPLNYNPATAVGRQVRRQPGRRARILQALYLSGKPARSPPTRPAGRTP